MAAYSQQRFVLYRCFWPTQRPAIRLGIATHLVSFAFKCADVAACDAVLISHHGKSCYSRWWADGGKQLVYETLATLLDRLRTKTDRLLKLLFPVNKNQRQQLVLMWRNSSVVIPRFIVYFWVFWCAYSTVKWCTLRIRHCRTSSPLCHRLQLSPTNHLRLSCLLRLWCRRCDVTFPSFCISFTPVFHRFVTRVPDRQRVKTLGLWRRFLHGFCWFIRVNC